VRTPDVIQEAENCHALSNSFPTWLAEWILPRRRYPRAVPESCRLSVAPINGRAFKIRLSVSILVRFRVWQHLREHTWYGFGEIGHFQSFDPSNVVVNSICVGEFDLIGCLAS